jgi:hypothetical protein
MTLIGTMGDIDDYNVQSLIWGSAVSGDLLEFSAMVAEGREHHSKPQWDRTQAWLNTGTITLPNEPPRRPKEWSALPWVSEHLTRERAPWPGL